MPKTSLIQQSFNSGELSPQLQGRDDLAQYANGCEILENMIPKVHGPCAKRPGTVFVNEVKDSTDDTVLLEFQFNEEQAYILELGDQYMRFYRNGGVILLASVPYEITTPYSPSDLSTLRTAQSADVMYIVSGNHAPYKLSRTTDTNWSLDEVLFAKPPFRDQNTDTTLTMTASAPISAPIGITASSAYFDPSHVGSYIEFSENIGSKYDTWQAGQAVTLGDYRVYDGHLYIADTTATTGSRPPIHTSGTESDGTVDWAYHHDGTGYAKLVAYTSSTQMTAEVKTRLPQSSLTGVDEWSEASWSDYRGWPKAVAFYEDRLWFAGSSSKPQTLWASGSGDYENHTYGTDDDLALNYTVNARELNAISWIIGGKVLELGTGGGEFTASASSLNEAITPTNVKITPQSSHGSSDADALRVDNNTLFIQKAKRKVREYGYDYTSDSYKTANTTVLANHILSEGGEEMSYQQEPDQIVWVRTGNGDLVGLTYEKEQQVTGWHRHTFNGEVKSIATIPHWDGDRDVTWMIVERVIDGNTVKYIEYFSEYLEDDTATFVDSSLTYQGSPVTSLSGLDHLEGETVSLIADGATHPDVVVTSGQITLQVAASTVVVGLGYTSIVKTMKMKGGAADGASQGKTARINNVTFRLHETGPGLWFGSDSSSMTELHMRSASDPMDNSVPLFTGDTETLSWPDGYDKGVQVRIEHRLPLPFTLIAIMPQVTVYDR